MKSAYIPSGSTDVALVYDAEDAICEPYQLGLRLCTGRTAGLTTFEAKVYILVGNPCNFNVNFSPPWTVLECKRLCMPGLYLLLLCYYLC